jgi:hypothetical protein
LEHPVKRGDFLKCVSKSVSGLAAAGVLAPAPAIWSPAKAEARAETLLIVSEGGPNNLDIHGVGTNGESWSRDRPNRSWVIPRMPIQGLTAIPHPPLPVH